MLGWNHRLAKILVIALIIFTILGMSKTISFIIIITNDVDANVIISIVIVIFRIIIIIRVNLFNEDLINTASVVVGGVTIVVVIAIVVGGVVIT